MGNESKQQIRQIDPQLDFHSQIEHAQHGQIKVFSSKALPMTFLMRLERVSQQSRLYNYYQKIQDLQSPALLALYGFKIQRNEGCENCQNGDRTLEYWQYLNYSLENHIVDRSRRGVPFIESEMWHLLQVILIAAGVLAKFGILWEVHPSLLVITPEGKVKADWSHLQAANSHLSYFKALYQNQTSIMSWFSPEEHVLFRERGIPSRLDLEKCNVYKIGLVLLGVASLNCQPVLNQKSWKQVINYPQPLPSIINKCLQPDPKQRPSLRHLYSQCEEHFSSSYELMISQGRRQDFQQIQRESKLKGQYLKVNKNFTQIKDGSRQSRSYASNYDQRQSRGETKYESYDQRLMALKQYRRNLVYSRTQAG